MSSASAASSPAPLSFASLSLDKNQSMPLAVRKKEAAKPKKESAAEASPTSPAPAKAKPAAAAPAAKAAAPAAAAAAPKKTPETKAAAPAGAGADNNKAKASKPAAAAASSSASSSPPAVKADGADIKPRVYKSGYAMVKAVNSGDSLVLAGSSAAGVDTPEKLISLTGVLAPKFGRGKGKPDEAFAWESREYLRKHVIGQQVQFTVQHTLESDSGDDRHYGVVMLKETDIAEQMLRAGWVRVKEPKDGGKVHADRLELQKLQDEAKAKGLGMWKKGVNAEDHKRVIDWTPNAQTLFTANKNVPLPGVVDQVRDGSTLRVELVHKDNPLKHQMITLYLAGVSCPRTPLPLSVLVKQHDAKKSEPGFKGSASPPTKAEKAEPFAMEAQSFTEDRLLNRDVQVVLQGVDKAGNLFGSVVFAKGNISLKLLELGLGKLVPWSAALTPDAAKLKAAEAQAKAQKLRTWAQWSAGQDAASSSSSSGSGQLAEFTGKVVSIPSADSVIVEDASGKEVRVWLASVRVPRLAQYSKDNKKEKDEPFAQEAKELLRSKLIGHKVRVVPEYVRAAAKDDDRAARQFASIFQNKINIGEALISAGYAEALQHRMDEERSQFYDVYLSAEQKAQEAKRGKWDLSKAHVAERIVDLTERIRPVKRAPPAAAPKAKKTNEDGTEADAEEEKESNKAAAAPAPLTKAQLEQQGKSKALSQLANTYLAQLHREKKINAVVEFVFSAGRFKLLVPSQHVLISFSLAGIRTPATKGADGKPDPLATEITNYMRAKVQQHSVTIEVEVKDKADNFLGSMFHNRVNLAVDLLEKGYASIFGFSAMKNPYAKDLFAAEAKAKEAREGLWKDFDFEKEKADKLAAGIVSYGNEEESKQDSGPSERVVKITEIVDAGDFFVQFVGDKNAEAVTKALEAVAALPEPEQPYQKPENIKGPVIVAGQFSDDSWHRVRLDSNENGDWNVYFIDFGNHDTLLADRIRALPADIAKIPALAVHCALSGLTPPKQAEYQEGSALAFSEMAFGVELQATIDFSDKFGRKHVTLSHESHPISVNRQLVRDGWARVQTKPDRRIAKRMDDLNDEEKYAKDHHYNLFEYGDVSDEEEEGTVRVAGPDPKARPPRGAAPKPAGK